MARGGDLVQLEHEEEPLFPERPPSRAGTRKRSYTADLRQLRHDVRAERRRFYQLAVAEGHAVEWIQSVGPSPPRVRADCIGGERPCPWFRCRYHLAVDVTPAGGLQFTWPGLDLDDVPETCALDIADRGAATLDRIAAALNMAPTRVQQLELGALLRLQAKMPRLVGEAPNRPPASASDEDAAGRRAGPRPRLLEILPTPG